MKKNYKDNLEEISQSSFLLEILLWALTVNIIIELLSRSAFINLINHIISHPLYFIYNVIILGFTLSLSAFFKRKRIALTVISAIWIALGIGNYIVLSYRITPFAAIDLSIMEWDLEFLESYLSIPIIVAVILGSLGLGSILFAVIKRAKPSQIQLQRAIFTSSVLFIIICSLYSVFLDFEIYEDRISNMQVSYDKFGFVSCFTRSATERGIDKPQDYSEILMDDVIANLSTTPEEPSVKPNIIVVQLESFFDPDILKDTEFSENPIPTFTQLSEEYSSGKLEVSVVGAGTANTEFEVLTSMSVDFFGTGEYPYETILQEEACESAAYNLSKLGYTTFAMHNNTGTFYERHEVYPNLGFDTFISSEFMADTTTTPQGWIKDKYLTPEIIKCLDSTEGQDFIFAVSVQGHGSFPEEAMENPIIEVTASPFEGTLENQVEYYANQIYEMDLFVKELVEYLSALEEPTMLVLYGDHIPSLDIDASCFEDGDNYQTSYVIWTNYAVEEVDQDLCTYQLLPAAFDMVDIHEGVLTRLHQEKATDEKYLEYMEMIQYDLLYGDIYIYDGAEYVPTEMEMGIGQMTIKAYFDGEYIYLTSSDITESSVVFINGQKRKSELTASGNLKIAVEDIEIGDSIVIKQISPDNTVLYESEAFEL